MRANLKFRSNWQKQSKPMFSGKITQNDRWFLAKSLKMRANFLKLRSNWHKPCNPMFSGKNDSICAETDSNCVETGTNRANPCFQVKSIKMRVKCLKLRSNWHKLCKPMFSGKINQNACKLTPIELQTGV
jgi:hypothetical protein